MPFKSKAQQRKFYADPKLREHAPHWSDETKKTKKGFKGLPEKVKRKKKKPPPPMKNSSALVGRKNTLTSTSKMKKRRTPKKSNS